MSDSSPTTADRLRAELAFNASRADHEPVTDSSLTYGDLRALASQRNLLIEAERAIEEYSCRTPVPHTASEMEGLAGRIRRALSEDYTQLSDIASKIAADVFLYMPQWHFDEEVTAAIHGAVQKAAVAAMSGSPRALKGRKP